MSVFAIAIKIPTDPFGGDGSDGDITVSSNINFNVTAIADSRTDPEAPYYRVNNITSNYVALAASPVGMVAGDEVVLINIMGRSGYWDNGGNYEFFTIDYIDGNDVHFTSSIEKSYGDTANENLTSHPVMLQRVPNYNNVTVDSGAYILCTDVPDGVNELGGLVAFRVKNTLTLNNGFISANSRGYGGGSSSRTNGYGRGYGIGQPTASGNGSGGGFKTQGGATYSGPYHAGGAQYGVDNLSKLHVGSGGGRGCYVSAWYGRGGDGGGAIFLGVQTINVISGGIQARGQNGASGYGTSADGGGGSGGAVLIYGGDITIPDNVIDTNRGVNVGVGGGDGSYGRIAVYWKNSLSLGATIPASPYTSQF